MKIGSVLVVAATVLAANTALALEFQPMGSIGMGGAGVARTFDGAAAYWNPGALAFEADRVAVKIGGSAGYQIDDNLAGNVDRLSTLNDPTTGTLNFGGNAAQNRSAMGEIIQLVGVMNDLQRGGNNSLWLNGTSFIGARIGHFGTGIFGTLQGAGTPQTDLVNIRPTGVTSPADLAAGIGATTSGTPTFFSAQQFATIAKAFGGGTTGNNIAFAFDQQLAAANTTHISSAAATDALIRLGNAIAPSSAAGNIDTNRSSLQTRGIALFEVPLAYGYPIDLGPLGTLGIGATVKLMAGRVFISSTNLFSTNSGDIFRNLTKDHEDSLSWGIDLGALWKWQNVNVGVVAKNLNTPKFSTAQLDTTEDGFRIRPQVRGGVAVDLLTWLDVSADIDLTKNETVLPGLKSQNVGGGVELRPADWFKLRLGAYKNIVASGFGPVATAGLTVGPKWFNVDLEAAASPETGEYNGHSYPREAKVLFAVNSQF